MLAEPSITIELVPVAAEHLPQLYRLMLDRGHRWTRLGATGLPSPLEFEDRLWKSCGAGFAARHGPSIVGFASIFDLRARDGVAWVEAEFFTGCPVDIVDGARLEICRHAFEALRLRKVYCAVLADEIALYPLDGSWVEEGILEAYDLVDGVYLDRVICSNRRPG